MTIARRTLMRLLKNFGERPGQLRPRRGARRCVCRARCPSQREIKSMPHTWGGAGGAARRHSNFRRHRQLLIFLLILLGFAAHGGEPDDVAWSLEVIWARFTESMGKQWTRSEASLLSALQSIPNTVRVCEKKHLT